MNKLSNIYKYSISSHIAKLLKHIRPQRKKQFSLLLLLMIVSAFAEVFSIGAILPFLSVLLDPEMVFQHKYANSFIKLFDINTPEELLLPITILFGIAALFAGSMRLLLLLATTRLAYSTGADLTIDVYRRTLYQPYIVHIGRNSSSVINVMVSKVNSAIQSTLIPILQIISSIIMISITLTFLISIEPVISSITFAGFGMIYILVILLTNFSLASNSKRIAFEHNQVVKLLQEGLGAIRNIILNGNQDLYCDLYQKSDIPLRRAQGTNVFIGASPRFGIEALAMALLGFMAYFATTSDGGLSKAIPLIGILTLGAQRLLPVIQQIFVSWASIQSSRSSVEDTIDFLEQKIPETVESSLSKKISFKDNITIKNLSFRYSDEEPWILKDINLIIKKGSITGFIGSTGTGKSTLIDIIMGLLEPSKGSVFIDGEEINKDNIHSWRSHIAEVPQMIFLSDDTIQNNIALGVDPTQVDQMKVKESAKRAKIDDIIEAWPKKYSSLVGERGVRLSGGQRQRIGIARAIYKNSDVLVFDEATSALDSKTEKKVIHDINNLGKNLTIMMIAHRITTLEKCDQIVELENGKIKKISSFNDL
jgi:ATP-binding cassette, subfamily B, bacterial PglK